MKTALILAPHAPRQKGADKVAEWALHAFKAYRFGLLRQGVHVKRINYEALSDLPGILRSSRADVAFVCTSWRAGRQETVDAFREVHRQRDGGPKLVYLDTFDQSSSPFFGVLPYVDLYVKKQVLRDRSHYLREVETGYTFGEFAAQSLGADHADWHFGSVIESPELLQKLVAGWNLGTASHLMKRLRKVKPGAYGSLASRAIDVQYRVGLKGPEDKGAYYNAHRVSVSRGLEALEGRKVVNVAGDGPRITPDEFRTELASCKLCVSAFGWGEVTDRDFEVVINEGALVKPDMSHLETAPDIYRPGETYLPFHWDGSNLAEVCEQALQNLEQTQQIARNARRVYEDWIRNKDFVKVVTGLLDRLGI